MIWIDVYFDVYVFVSSLLGNVYGMLLVVFFGFGDFEMVKVFGLILDLMWIVLIGVYSYEKVEIEFLNELGVCVFVMNEIDECGLLDVFSEVCCIVGNGLWGISFDIDVIDFELVFGVLILVVGGLLFEVFG